MLVPITNKLGETLSINSDLMMGTRVEIKPILDGSGNYTQRQIVNVLIEMQNERCIIFAQYEFNDMGLELAKECHNRLVGVINKYLAEGGQSETK